MLGLVEQKKWQENAPQLMAGQLVDSNMPRCTDTDFDVELLLSNNLDYCTDDPPL